MKLTQRFAAKTPPFFSKVRNIGLVLTAISGALMGVPALPVIIVKIAGYLAVAGTVMSGVSQAAVQKEEEG
ncbi:hypothetical protein SAMN05660909_05578 [Chitinophaga terrae (ex Kim and Jung 2007)]|uniref:Uncharacterized protein n=1 Tax=Chitinophaga terrae (ex Kim and Jung 2007) TaxID=408074 RepID=A0A1H4GPZ3_9BACT|nr:hypothetical protein [Chitinophaga terrae (ex Kim and Jung 2007)]GEP93660.1 hypothetical protein CTE07_53050 [Chitinophaga terrae (ex Kim and Jung 2007)]SEB11391.1 hypothetical protein SAMN05660909_05578 [Chitinophaga terrae (ex Kim and Jung 2007)]